MRIRFYKYQGTGNDFILIDDRLKKFPSQDHDFIKELCHRRFGIGADGLILLQEEAGYDFKMVYFNADGNESTMCGNGGRCITSFAQHIGLIENKAYFLAIDGPHDALIKADKKVALKMIDVSSIEEANGDYILDTGSPHYIRFVDDNTNMDLQIEAKKIRYNDRFKEEGINVNFVMKSEEGIDVRTYERGVEDETLSCGTGVTACGLAWASLHKLEEEIPISTKGGLLTVRFEKKDSGYQSIWLSGPTQFIFEGLL